MCDSEDINNRINEASKYLGVLKFIWNDISVPIETKIKLLSTITLIFCRRIEPIGVVVKKTLENFKHSKKKLFGEFLQQR